MNLFTSAGVELPKRGRAMRTARVPLISHKVIKDVLTRIHFDSTEEQRKIAADYAVIARSEKLALRNEVQVRGRFYDDILCKILGYTKIDPNNSYTLDIERAVRGGSVDAALGRFPGPNGKDEILAPLEMKGPKATDLEAVSPGRGRSPVQQAWDYAMDSPGSRWVLVSNCIELRLYAFGRGRDAYELFDLTKLDQEAELERLWLLLSSKRFIGGDTEDLLRQSDNVYKDITDNLYSEYASLRTRLLTFLSVTSEGPSLSHNVALELAQKILDRILFVAFAQRTDLLPDKLLERASKERNAFRPEPLWHNFNALFRSIDIGNESLAINAYNGGLFAPDPIADALIIPDPLATNLADLAKWDYRSEVPVTVLGHIFEQSISDLEKLRSTKVEQPEGKVSRRKREGVVYTPDIVTRFLVERTIGTSLAEKFNTLLDFHADGKLPDDDLINWKDGEFSERAFWKDYTGTLRSLKVIDPACGSGAFLVAAFDLLAREYRRAIERLLSLNEDVDFDFYDEIITKNLYGVDLNAESVEITRLSLWLKTARRQHQLQNLEATIKVGNTLVSDRTVTNRAFDWEQSFAGFEAKFDIVIGNPPYVRSETISELKPYLRSAYECFDSGADLYCYFFEKGMRLLKDGGRLGFISSSGFFKTAFGHKLREYLSRTGTFECGVDFGDARIFEDVTTYPAVLTIKKAESKTPYTFRFLNYTGNGSDSLEIHFKMDGFEYPSERLHRSRWHFEPSLLRDLRDSLEKNAGAPLGKLAAPVSGIKTGLTKAFVLDETTRKKMVSDDPGAEKLIRRWTVGDDLDRWVPERSDHFIIFIPKGWTKAELGETDESTAWSKLKDTYPSVAEWLTQFEVDARKRSDQGDYWWELRACDYYELFDQEIVTFPEMSQGPKFGIKESGTVSNNKTFLIPKSDTALLAILNSRASWFLLRGICTALRGGKWRLELRADFLKELPLPELNAKQSALLSHLAQHCITRAEENNAIKIAVRRRIGDLNSGKTSKLSRKLFNWWLLDFTEFRSEIKRAFRTEIPIKERGEWEQFLNENAEKIDVIKNDIEKVTREIDERIYEAFGLTMEQVSVLECSLLGQY